MDNRIGLLIIGLVMFLMVLSPAKAQVMYGQPASGEVHFIYSHWNVKYGDTTVKISQLTFPVTGFLPIRDNLEAVVYLAGSSNDVKLPDATNYSLSGLGDMRLQFNRSFKEDQLLLSVGVNLPTGKKKLSAANETPVLHMLSQNFLDFSMRRFGEGFGFSMLLGGAQKFGEWRCGAGLMYKFSGKYEPYERIGKYDPGDLISLNAGADWFNDKMSLSGNVVYAFYTSDKLDGREMFRQSTQLNMDVSFGYRIEDLQLNAGVGYLLRGRNTLYLEEEDKLKIYGNEFRLRGGAIWALAQDWHIGPTAELKLIAANEKELGSSTILNIGGTVARDISDQVDVFGGIEYFTGQANGGDIDLSGLQLTVGVTASL
ncbi:MAG: transporter [candidate division Zixibacteria bacterium]|nr:transporter [candidate division Zixibacteria bacterium]